MLPTWWLLPATHALQPPPPTALATPSPRAALVLEGLDAVLRHGKCVEKTVSRTLRAGSRSGVLSCNEQRAAVAESLFGVSMLRARLAHLAMATNLEPKPAAINVRSITPRAALAFAGAASRPALPPNASVMSSDALTAEVLTAAWPSCSKEPPADDPSSPAPTEASLTVSSADAQPATAHDQLKRQRAPLPPRAACLSPIARMRDAMSCDAPRAGPDRAPDEVSSVR